MRGGTTVVGVVGLWRFNDLLGFPIGSARDLFHLLLTNTPSC